MKPSIAIIYLSFHCEPYIEQTAASLASMSYPKERVAFVIVDNPHPEYGGSGDHIREHVMSRSRKDLPRVVLIENEKNLGFAGGNNVGLRWALDNDYDYVVFLNDDAYLGEDTLAELVAHMSADERIAIAQPLIMLSPEKQLVNSSGNAMHVLAMGYCMDYRRNAADLALPAVRDVPYASGAAMMMRTKKAVASGGWDKDFFMYHEDMEWSLRCRILGGRVVMVRDGIAYHTYNFSKSIKKYYWMERNRFAVLLMYYRWPTLILLAPILLLTEFGLFGIALTRGWWKEKLAVYRYWLDPAHVRLWLKKRAIIQKQRLVSDRFLLSHVTGIIAFQEGDVSSPWVTHVANPILKRYTALLKSIVIW